MRPRQRTEYLFSFILVICLAAVFSLAPFALYLLWLTTLNRRVHPTILGGGWDFAALLGGLAGFVLFGGGLFLALVQSNVRFLMRGNVEALRDAWGHEQLTWTLTAAAYLIIVVGGCVLTLMARRRTLVIYNVDPGQFEVTLAEIFDQMGRAVERRGNLWVSGVPLLELERSESGRTVIVRWVSNDLHLFQEIERHLREAIPSLRGGDNLAARWLMSGAVSSLVIVVFCCVLLVYGLALRR